MASKTVIRPIASGKHVLKFLTNRNIFYDMHLSYGVCRLRARMHLKTLSSLLNSSRVFDKRASGNYVLPRPENCHCAFPLVECLPTRIGYFNRVQLT